MGEYYPLVEGLKLRYSHTSTQFKGLESCELLFGAIENEDGELRAQASLTRTRSADMRQESFIVRKTGKGVFAEGGLLGIARQEFPLPPAVGTTWFEAPDETDQSEVMSLSETKETEAGRFLNCLRVDTFLAGGDAGTARRWYAPGVGLVFEEYAAESWGATVELMEVDEPK